MREKIVREVVNSGQVINDGVGKPTSLSQTRLYILMDCGRTASTVLKIILWPSKSNWLILHQWEAASKLSDRS